MSDTKLTPDELNKWLSVNVLKWERDPDEPKLWRIPLDADTLARYKAKGMVSTHRRAHERTFNPTTDLNHAKMVWDALEDKDRHSVAEKLVSSAADPFCSTLMSDTLDPEKLCRAIHAVCKGE